jgi:hypothetical protein
MSWSNQVGRRPQLSRAKTQNVVDSDVVFLVLEHKAHDNKTERSLAAHQKRISWKVALVHDLRPMEFAVSVDQRATFNPEVNVTKDGEQLFPSEGSKTMAKLSSDFIWTQPMRGKLPDIGKTGVYLVRPLHGREQWYKATITEQHNDQTFDATALVPSTDPSQPQKGTEVQLQNLPVQNIRRVGKGGAGHNMEKVEIPQRNLVLTVPAKEPVKATLAVDDGSGRPETEEDIGKLLGRVSPCIAIKSAVGDQPVPCKGTSLQLVLSKEDDRGRKSISGNACQAVVEQFLTSEPRAVKTEASMDSHSWTVQLGPFAEHTIVLERRHKGSHMLTLTVDGELLVESSGPDLGSPNGYWKATFRFVGEKTLEWNLEAMGLGIVRQKKEKVDYECMILFEESKKELRTARFTIDEEDFKEMPDKIDTAGHRNIDNVEYDQFKRAYNIEAPRINAAAPRSPPPAASAGGWLFSCCQTPPVVGAGAEEVSLSRVDR